jgi:hypothetical protein
MTPSIKPITSWVALTSKAPKRKIETIPNRITTLMWEKTTVSPNSIASFNFAFVPITNAAITDFPCPGSSACSAPSPNAEIINNKLPKVIKSI